MSRKPLPFIRFYPADYMADTMHLTTLEHGAYDLILWNYWSRQQPPHESKLPGITKMSKDEFQSVRDTLAEFFDIRDGVWTQKRVELELQRIKEEAKRNRRAGKLSAKSRREKAEMNARSTGVQHESNARSQSVEQVIRSNEKSSIPVPIAKQRLTKVENELVDARARVWKLEDECKKAESEVKQVTGEGGEQ